MDTVLLNRQLLAIAAFLEFEKKEQSYCLKSHNTKMEMGKRIQRCDENIETCPCSNESNVLDYAPGITQRSHTPYREKRTRHRKKNNSRKLLLSWPKGDTINNIGMALRRAGAKCNHTASHTNTRLRKMMRTHLHTHKNHRNQHEER
jgi:hypothetical protein